MSGQAPTYYRDFFISANPSTGSTVLTTRVLRAGLGAFGGFTTLGGRGRRFFVPRGLRMSEDVKKRIDGRVEFSCEVETLEFSNSFEE